MKRLLLVFAVLSLAAASSVAAVHGGGGHGGGGGHASGIVGHSGGGGGRSGGGGYTFVSRGGSRGVVHAARSGGSAVFNGRSGVFSGKQHGIVNATTNGHAARGTAARGSTAQARGVGPEAPPNFSKPGALIRTEGQLPVYSDPGNARTHGVDGGGFISAPPLGRGAAAVIAGGNGVTENTRSAFSNVPAFDPSF